MTANLAFWLESGEHTAKHINKVICPKCNLRLNIWTNDG
jgi:hypothetical protein